VCSVSDCVRVCKRKREKDDISQFALEHIKREKKTSREREKKDIERERKKKDIERERKTEQFEMFEDI